jgi:DnaJ-class molecular chaperone
MSKEYTKEELDCLDKSSMAYADMAYADELEKEDDLCHHCDGTGLDEDEITICRTCGGKGKN